MHSTVDELRASASGVSDLLRTAPFYEAGLVKRVMGSAFYSSFFAGSLGANSCEVPINLAITHRLILTVGFPDPGV